MGDTRSSLKESADVSAKSENKESAEDDHINRCSDGFNGTRVSAVKDSLLRQKLSTTIAPIQKKKGQLLYKKKGTFSKWKEYFAILDEAKLQLNFYQNESDQETLNIIKISVDLRFLEKIMPSKGGILSKKSCFKIYRRAGLSTVQLATHSDEERAEWITTLELLTKRVKYSPEMRNLAITNSSTLPQRQSMSPYIHQTDSSKSPRLSATDEYQIKPRKLSNPGFLINSSTISNIKLKRASSELSSNDRKYEKSKDGETKSENTFGIQLKKIDLEEMKVQKSKELTIEETELQIKYNSLSKTKRSPKLPLNENVKHSVGDEAVTDGLFNVSPRSSPVKTEARKISHVSNIPLSKSVQSVVQNNSKTEAAKTEKKIVTEVNTLPNIPEKKLCHAITTEIPTFECELKELNGAKLNGLPDTWKAPNPVVVSESSNNEGDQTILKNVELSTDQNNTNTNSPESVNLAKSYPSGIPKTLKTSLEVTLLSTQGPKKPPRSYSFESKKAHSKVKKMLSYCGTTELENIKTRRTSDAYSIKTNVLDRLQSDALQTNTDVDKTREKYNIENTIHLSEDSTIPLLEPASPKNEPVSTAQNQIDSVRIEQYFEKDETVLKSNQESEYNENEESAAAKNDAASKVSNDIVIAAINNAFDECLSNINDTDENNSENAMPCEDTNNVITLKISSSESLESNEGEIWQCTSGVNEIINDKIETDLKSGVNEHEKENYRIEESQSRQNVKISVTQSEESFTKMLEEMNSPVEIRKDCLRNSLHGEEMKVNRPSTLSILSSESDDPLPKFNFLGKSERSSCNSSFFREQLSIDEEAIAEMSAQKEEMVGKICHSSSNDVEDDFISDIVIDFSEIFADHENEMMHDHLSISTESNQEGKRSSYIEEDIIPICNFDKLHENINEVNPKNVCELDISSKEIKDILDSIDKKTDSFPTTEATDSFPTIEEMDSFPTIEETDSFHTIEDTDSFHTIEETDLFHTTEEMGLFPVIEETDLFPTIEDTGLFPAIEETDSFPTTEETDRRLDLLSLAETSPIRTSGIIGLNEYLSCNTAEEEETELSSGVNRLGASVAVEKLKDQISEI